MKISISKINIFFDCPRKYWYLYQVRLQTPKSEGYYFGSAVHEGLDNFYTGKDPMEGVRKALFGKKDRVGETVKEGVDLYKLYSQAKKIFDVYPKLAKKFIPILVEHRFEVKLIHPETKEGLRATFEGKIDLVTDKGDIIDHKTASGSDNGFFERKNALQANGYAYGYWSSFGKLPHSFIFNTIIKGNTRNQPRVEPKSRQISLEDICGFFDTCKYVLGEISGKRTQNTPKISHCRFCPFKDVCEYNRR